MPIVATGYCFLQLADDIRVESVVLLAVDVLQQATLDDRLARFPGHGSQLLLVLLEVVEASPLDTAGHTFETQVNDVVSQPDRLEQLGAPVGGDGRDPHFGEDLQQPLVDALPVVVLGVNRIHQQFAGADQIVQDLVSEVRVHRCRTKTEKHRKMVGITSPTGFNNDVGIAAQPFLDQVMVNGTGCHQGVDRQLSFLQILVCEDQKHLTIPDSLLRLLANLVNRLLQTLLRAVAHGDPRHLEPGTLVVGDLQELGRREYRRGQDDSIRVIGGFLEHVTLGTQTGLQRHNDCLTQGVDRRVGHLGELLPEIIRYVAHFAGEHGHRGIVTHGPNRFLAVLCQRTQDLVTLFEGDHEHFLMYQKLVGVHQPEVRCVLIQGGFHAQGVLAQPALVGLRGLQALVNVFGMQDFTGFGVDSQHLPRPDTAFGNHVVGLVPVGTDL